MPKVSDKTSGVYVEERAAAPPPIAGAATALTGFIGTVRRGPAGRARRVLCWRDYELAFGGDDGGEMSLAVRAFFANGGMDARVVRVRRRAPLSRWLAALEAIAGCSLIVLPGLRDLGEADQREIAVAAARHCLAHRAFLILDPPASAASIGAATGWASGLVPKLGEAAGNVAAYWPDLLARVGDADRRIAPGGAVAGIYARTDRAPGVWHAPAGVDAQVMDLSGPALRLAEPEMAQLVAASVNPVRDVRSSIVLWGSRTLSGSGAEWKYVPVRRMALFIERSLYGGLEWVVFEPNDEPLWAKVRRGVGNFMHGLWTQGAFQGSRPRDGYFVRCDQTTMTQGDIDAGRLVLEVGFAPLRPAEFVVLRIGHFTANADPDDD